MKFIGFCLRLNNKSGIILIVVLWVLAILSVLAVGLGRNARIDLALVKHRVGKLKADSLIFAAYNYSTNQIRLDTENQKSLATDTVYRCGVDLQEDTIPEDIFKNVSLADGFFDISYALEDDLGRQDICYGFQDEERRINLNGIDRSNYGILVNLLMLTGLSEQQAEMLAAQVVDWHDTDSEKMTISYGAEKDDYLSSSKPYRCKDLPFENIEELLLLKDMTEDVFKKVKNYLTVFPQSNVSLLLNINTAPELVLKSVFRFIVGQNPSVEIGDADSLVAKIASYRKGDDGRLCTADDRPIRSTEIGALSLNPNENAIYLMASNYFKENSQFFRARAKGVDHLYHVSSQTDMIINREDLSVVSWKRK